MKQDTERIGSDCVSEKIEKSVEKGAYAADPHVLTGVNCDPEIQVRGT